MWTSLLQNGAASRQHETARPHARTAAVERPCVVSSVASHPRPSGASSVTHPISDEERVRFSLTVDETRVKRAAVMQMQTQTIEQKKTGPVRPAWKPEGWREREESRTARVAPSAPKKSNEPAHIRCGR